MPILPLDLQQLYMQQSHIGRMEHVRQTVKTIVMQAEDKDIHQDSYEKDSIVVKAEESSNENTVKERKESKKDGQKHYVSYRKKRRKDNPDDKNNIIETVDIDLESDTKGHTIDILG